MELVIATFNIQNKYKLKNYSGVDEFGNHVKSLVDFINHYHIDILGVQELTKPYKNNLYSLLLKDYMITGKYRFTSLGNLIPIIKKYNESNSIITRYPLLDSDTKRLPFFPNIPRIITCTSFVIHDRKIRIYNTHLDQKSDTIRKKQLKMILSMIEKSRSECVLMGDFNCSIKHEYFNHFVDEMKNLNMKLVEIEKPTHKKIKYPIDHIFIPKDWKVKEKSVVEVGMKTSDHMPIVVKLQI